MTNPTESRGDKDAVLFPPTRADALAPRHARLLPFQGTDPAAAGPQRPRHARPTDRTVNHTVTSPTFILTNPCRMKCHGFAGGNAPQ